MEKKTIGTVLSVRKQWWLKVNTKPIRMGASDGARFPHVVKIRYTVDGNEMIKRKWIGAYLTPPQVNASVTVIYREDKPTSVRIEGL